MGPLTLSALVAGSVALSSDICVSAFTYKIMSKKPSVEPQSDDIKNLLRRRGSYANLHTQS